MRIRINSIRPDVIETGLNRESLGSPAVREAAMADTPLGRIGSSDDIVRAAPFLVSDESEFITGTDLVVDGGMTSLRVPGVPAAPAGRGRGRSK